ncbi:MAG TPA: hypothetical protein VFB59_01080 [Candidatus Saccharimonadales bacterium]|nr:hypothetical protein [Candidatus Saccharimonadales bacterium]
MSLAKRSLVLAVAVLMTGFVAAAFMPTDTVVAAPCDPGANCEVQACKDGDACDTFIDNYIYPFVRLLTISIGIIATISVVVAGIQYASAGDDPAKVQKAKSRIFQTIIGLVAYFFLFAFLNYIVPGGLV